MRRISLVAVGLVGLVATACTNGLEKKPAAQVEREAVAALKSARTVHVKGTASGSDGRPVRLDLRIKGNSTDGTIGLRGEQFAILTIGADTYIKADRRGWQVLGASALPQRFAGRWVKLQPGQVRETPGFSLETLAAQVTAGDSPLQPRVEQAKLDDARRKVVVVSRQDGSKLYVADTRKPYPLRIERKGADAGRIDFTEYGAYVYIAAPSEPVDLENAWLEAISDLHTQLDNFAGPGAVNLTPQLMRVLAKTLRRCDRELAELGSPGKRMQPAYALAKQACGEYDKAARCFATAASLGITFEGSAGDRRQRQAIDCGFSAPNNGGELMADAEAKGFEIAHAG